MFSKLRTKRNIVITVITAVIAFGSVSLYRSATAAGNDDVVQDPDVQGAQPRSSAA